MEVPPPGRYFGPFRGTLVLMTYTGSSAYLGTFVWLKYLLSIFVQSFKSEEIKTISAGGFGEGGEEGAITVPGIPAVRHLEHALFRARTSRAEQR